MTEKLSLFRKVKMGLVELAIMVLEPVIVKQEEREQKAQEELLRRVSGRPKVESNTGEVKQTS